MKKKSVLIVDKQKNMLNIYKNMINWDEYGYEILAIIDNEKAAVSSFGEYLYDLVITDIELKEGNGLSFISRIKKSWPESCMVVISQYTDFESVRMAMKLGAYDYFAKSKLRYSDFITLLDELNTLNQKSLDNEEDDLNRLMGLLRDNQKIDEKRILKAINLDKYPILNGSYQLFLFRLDHVWKLFHTVIFNKDKDLLHDSIRYELEKTFKSIPNATILFSKKHSGIVLIPPCDIELLKNKANTLLNNLENGTGFTFSLTISSCVQGVHSFYSQYCKTLYYHNWKFYDGDNSVCIMENKTEFNDLKLSDISLYTQQLYHVNVRDFQKTMLIKNQLIEYFIKHTIHPLQIIAYFNEVIASIANNEYDLIKLKSDEIENMQLVLTKCETWNELSIHLEQCFQQIANWIFEKNSSKYKKNVNQILLYVEANIDKKITLEMIANHLKMSEIHVSRMFKLETGKNLIQYINEQKMSRAVEYMQDTKLKIKDIALKVGFEDQLYFNKVFKKIYQISPSQYRRSR